MRPQRRRGVICMVFALGWAALVSIATGAQADPPDALLPLVNRINDYLHRYEIDGITHDPRYAANPSETIRLSVVSQLLAYNDLHVAASRPGYYTDIVERADFLLVHLSEIRSNSAFDGMLAYALLGAYEITHDPRYLAAAEPIVRLCKSLRGSANTLNWGLMSAMALAKYYDLTGDTSYRDKVREILLSCVPYQHANGSFPHYCAGSTDVHYTAWMGMELVHIGRYVDDGWSLTMLDGIHDFLAGRADAMGRISYQSPCAGVPACWIRYDSRGTGCSIDYDTRAWVNELGYFALVFDHFRQPQYAEVLGFLYTLGSYGVFPDKWDFPADPTDPIYAWASNDSSVIRTSVILWSLATIYRDRTAPVPRRYDATAVESEVPVLAARASGAIEADLEIIDAGTDPEPDAGTAPRQLLWSTVDSLYLAGVEPKDVPAEPVAGVRPGAPGQAAAVAPVDSRPDASAAPDVRGVRGILLEPNPTSEAARISFTLSRSCDVSLKVYDPTGRVVRAVVSEFRSAGAHQLRWDGRDAFGRPVPAGLYFVTVCAGRETASGRLLIVR